MISPLWQTYQVLMKRPVTDGRTILWGVTKNLIHNQEPSPPLEQQYLHEGDTKTNNTDKVRPTPCHPERFDAGEHMRQLDRQSSCQCKVHPEMQNQVPRPETKQQQQGRITGSFTPEMLKDQEYLVTSMSQQGIPEPLIRRQFERLLEEQTKQLRLLDPTEPVSVERKPSSRRLRQTPVATARVEPCAPETSCSRPQSVAQPYSQSQYCNQPPQFQQQFWQPALRGETQPEQTISSEGEHHQDQYYHHFYQQQQHPSNEAPQHQQIVGDASVTAASSSVDPPVTKDCNEDNQVNRRQRLVEPSTLVRLRKEREQALARAKNNGLQDPDASPALEALAKSRAEASRQRASHLRLNGTQEHDEMGEQLPLLPDFDAEAYMRAHQQQQATSRGCRSNGLENARLPSNPVPTRRSLHLRARQSLSDAEEIVPCYPPQKAYLQVVQYEQHQQRQQEEQVQHQQNQHWQMMQQIYEPMMTGGFVYNARKPSCVQTMPYTSTYANCCAPHGHHCTSTVG
ncbi:hypothetical protein QAD02_024301 [Eretmocerus hayati]|uniref:Uncharacterized protein n=1 Tax=Eretmocerus hayati TaxID=131215 RepID=A0ACC2PY81_9HYME|nr:hypothetical protein QAD02_024301 [Eretmocerus hayati]